MQNMTNRLLNKKRRTTVSTIPVQFGLKLSLFITLIAALAFTGCKHNNNNPAPNPYVLVDKTNPDIKAKFGDSTVSDAFTHLHELISAPHGADNFTTIIRLGDYIDLPSLTVAGYPTNIVDNGKISVADKELTGHGRLLRLIVVGINTYKNINGNGTTPHVVFQFQNIPGERKMNATNTNVGGYKESEMRKYLVKVGGVGGNFLAGLTAAGVPPNVLWAPSRRVWNGSGSTTVDTIADALFLPTEWEMFGSNTKSNGTYEKAANQGRFTYYAAGTDGDPSRIKYTSDNAEMVYWEASPCYGASSNFCLVGGTGNAMDFSASFISMGCAPAFCIK